MKFQKLVLSAVTACLMVGASGAAMAVDCAGGVIAYAQVEEIIIDKEVCFIHKVLVEKNVEIQGSPALVILDSTIGGTVLINGGGEAVVFGNTIAGDFLRVKNKKFAVIVANLVNGDIVVKLNDAARVSENRAAGNIVCEDNGELDAIGNQAEGDDECGGLLE